MDEILANINKKLEEIDRKKVSIGIDEEVKGGADPRTEVPDPMADFVDEDERETNNGMYSPTKSAAPRRRGSTTEVRTQCFVKIGLLSLISWWTNLKIVYLLGKIFLQIVQLDFIGGKFK